MVLLIPSLALIFLTFFAGQIFRMTLSSAIALNGLDITVSAFVILWGGYLLMKKKLYFPSVWKGLIIFISCAFFSFVLNAFFLPQSQIIVALLYLIRYVMYASLFFIVFSFSQKEKGLTTFFMVLSSAGIVGAGYVQFIFYPSLRNLLYAGWDEHLYRMFSTFLDPNFLGLFLSVFILFLLFLFFTSTMKFKKVLYAAVGIFSLVALFLTYSRTALLALCVGTFLFFFIKGNRKLLFLLLGFIVVASMVLFVTTGKRSEGTNLFRTVSSEARLSNMKDAFAIWQDNVVFGVGFNAYRYAQHRHGIYSNDWEVGHGGAGADNSFLFILSTTGIVGLGAYLYFLYTHIRLIRGNKNPLYVAVGISTIGALSVGSFFVNGLFYPPLMVWLWLVLGITESR